jgi:hypothetical protein
MAAGSGDPRWSASGSGDPRRARRGQETRAERELGAMGSGDPRWMAAGSGDPRRALLRRWEGWIGGVGAVAGGNVGDDLGGIFDFFGSSAADKEDAAAAADDECQISEEESR